MLDSNASADIVASMSEAQCPHQWAGVGCGRPAGHGDEHRDKARQAAWTSRATDTIGPWDRCPATHPTATFRCYMVTGHDGEHYALTVPLPEGEPSSFEDHPFVKWGKPSRKRAT